MLTVADYLQFLRASADFVNWPPDVFAVVMSLLQKSGAYTRAISDWWPPADRHSDVPLETQARLWAKRMKDIGVAWRAGVLSEPRLIPPEVKEWWRTVLMGDLKVSGIREDDRFCTALLQLCAVADEASVGVGLPPTRDDYDMQGWLALDDSMLVNAKVPLVRFHDLRHTAATLLLSQGVDPRTIMETLGHSQISLTLNTYSHVLPALQMAAADKLDAILNG